MGPIVVVTNLNEAGPGSFRGAWKETSGPRIIIPSVAGHVLQSESLTTDTGRTATSGDVIVLGQLAPRGGFHIRFRSDAVNRMIVNLGHNVALMFMSARMGSNNFGANDYASNYDMHDLVWTNLSSAYGKDENFTAYSTGENIVQQWCLSTRGIVGHSNASYFSTGSSMASADRPRMDAITLHHNFYDSCNHRMPLIGSNRCAVINNISHNALYYFMGFNEGQYVDFVGNEIKTGAQSRGVERHMFLHRDALGGILDRDPSVFIKDNVTSFGDDHGDADQWSIVFDEDGNSLPASFQRTERLADAEALPDYPNMRVHNMNHVRGIILQDSGNSRFINEDGRWERYRHPLDQALDNYVNGTGAQPTIAEAEAEMDANPGTFSSSYRTTNGMSDRWLAHHGLDGDADIWGNDLDPEWKNFWCFAFGLYPVPLS